MPQPRSKCPPAVDDPPLSSDDDDDTCSASSQPSTTDQRPGSLPNRIHSLHDSSYAERVARGSIRPTNFASVPKARPQQCAGRKRSGTIESPDPGAKEPDHDRASSTKRRRNSRSPPSFHGRGTPPPSSGDHFKDKHGFVSAKPSRAKYRFGARDRVKAQAEEKAAATNQRVNGPSLRTRGAKENVSKPPSDCTFDSPKKTSVGLLLPAKEHGLSPQKSPPTLQTSFFRTKIPSGNESNGSDPSSPTKSRKAKKSEKSKGKKEGQPPEESGSPTPTVLKIPTPFSDSGPRANGNNSKLETVLSDVASDVEKGNASASDLEVIGSDAEAGTAPTGCPWCGQPVNKSLLDDFSRGKRMNVRLQARFCRQHKRQTAMETWQAKRYPEVDWENLYKRFAAHRTFLLGIVNGKDSHFRRILAQKVESGQARSMKKEGNMNPGYYGPRGFDLMCDYLVDEFGELLKGRAVDDRVIAGRGSAAFIQTVLVAELAVQLIKNDMGVSAEAARSIMEESKALGEMIHEGS